MKLVTLYLLQHLDGLEKAYTQKWNVVKKTRLIQDKNKIKMTIKYMKLDPDFFTDFRDRIRVVKFKALKYKNKYYEVSKESELEIDE